MKKLYFISAGIAIVVIATIIWLKYPFFEHGDTPTPAPDMSPCTGAIEVEPSTPCVVDTGDIPEPGHGFFFRYPKNAGVTQSSLNVTTIEHSILSEDADPSYMGPFYLITFYYNDSASIDSFDAMFANGKPDVLAGKSVIKSTEAKFPNPEYPFTTAYYLDNNGKRVIAIIAGYDSDMLKQAEVIFIEGFRWEG